MSSTARHLLAFALGCMLIAPTADAVIPAPPQSWTFTTPSIEPSTGNGEDWIFGIVQTSDGGYLAGGYTDVNTGSGVRRHAALLKLDANRAVVWEKELGPGDALGTSFIWDVVETASAYVASGNKRPSGADSSLIIVSVPKNNPNAVQTFTFSPSQLGFGTGFNINGYSIRSVVDSNGEHGFIVGGTAFMSGPQAGYLLRLDNAFNPMPFGGNSNGVVRVQPAGPPTAGMYTKKVRVTHDSAGNVAGFVAVGEAPSPSVTGARDSFIAAYNLTGNLVATRTMNRNDLAAIGPYTAPTGQQSLCPSIPLDATNTSAFDLVELPGGDLVAAIHINGAAAFNPSGCSNARLNGFSYVDVNVALVRLSPALAPQWAKDIGRFSGVDFETPMVLMKDGLAVAGSDAITSNAVVHARVIKTDFDGNRQWLGDYLIPGDLNDCVFAATKTFEEGLVVAGNNDLNGEDYFAVKVAPLPDLWMKDVPADTGDEATPNGGILWTSDDIWVRRQQDFYPYPDQHNHENPEYRNPSLHLPNYVYAEVRNRGTLPASGIVKLYFAKASTGLAWPVDWQASTLCCGVPCGGALPPVAVVNLAPGATQIVQTEWYPPDPAAFAGGQCGPVAEQGHFCLLARIETTTGLPWGMTVPETLSVNSNTAANNNIVWKNVTIVDNVPGAGKKAFGFVRNALPTPARISLAFTAPVTQAGTLFDYADVEVTLSPELVRSWRAGGSLGTGIQQVTDSTLRLLRPGAVIEGINMQGRQMERFSVRLVPRIGIRGPQPGPMELDVTQSAGAGAGTAMVGGMRFTLEAPPALPRRRAVRH